MFLGELTKLAVTFADWQILLKYGDLIAIRCHTVVAAEFG